MDSQIRRPEGTAMIPNLASCLTQARELGDVQTPGPCLFPCPLGGERGELSDSQGPFTLLTLEIWGQWADVY